MNSAAAATRAFPAPRLSRPQVQDQIDAVEQDERVRTLLSFPGAMSMVLNGSGQILQANPELLQALGCDDDTAILGRRTGDALDCRHAHKGPDGCGSGPGCPACKMRAVGGEALLHDRPTHAQCIVARDPKGQTNSWVLDTRFVPLEVEGVRCIVALMMDSFDAQHDQVLHRIFLHDLFNELTTLQLLCEQSSNDTRYLLQIEASVSRCLELSSSQRDLLQAQTQALQPHCSPCSPADLLDSLRKGVEDHPSLHMYTIAWPDSSPDLQLNTDAVLVLRVLTNMLLNALQAVKSGQTVAVTCLQEDGGVSFSVHNPQAIPEPYVHRIFEPFNSSHKDPTRGLGTYSMKIIGEGILGGEVSFTTGEQGTRFVFFLPSAPPAREA